MFRNKVFVFFCVILLIFSFLCGSVYAVEDTQSDETYSFIYTCTDGVIYKFPAFPEELKQYNHYIVLKQSLSEDFTLIPFNESIEFVSYSDFFDVFVDGQKFGMHWTCNVLDGVVPDSWSIGMISDISGEASFLFSTSGNNIYYVVNSCLCSSSYLSDMEYAINNKDGFFLNRNQILVPIVEEVPLEGVIQEIVEILPVVLVVIVALIALRKAIAFLIQILKQS